jgi:hypothetical protein
MKRIGSVMLCCVAVAAIGASAALAGNGNGKPNPRKVASQECTGELHAMGAKNFKALYGDSAPKYQHAMKNCKAKHGKSGKNEVRNAARDCKAEQADPNFAAGHGGATFDEFYGTNTPNDKSKGTNRNAFGKCVSSKVQESLADDQEDLQNAAQMCRDERSDDPDAFRDNWGTNKKNKKNAFGKCVSKKAKELHNAPEPTTPTS